MYIHVHMYLPVCVLSLHTIHVHVLYIFMYNFMFVHVDDQMCRKMIGPLLEILMEYIVIDTGSLVINTHHTKIWNA